MGLHIGCELGGRVGTLVLAKYPFGTPHRCLKLLEVACGFDPKAQVVGVRAQKVGQPARYEPLRIDQLDGRASGKGSRRGSRCRQRRAVRMKSW